MANTLTGSFSIFYCIGVIFMCGNFREKPDKAPRIKFRGLNFVERRAVI